MKRILRALFFFTIFLVTLNIGFQLSTTSSQAFDAQQTEITPASTPDPATTVPTFEEPHQRNVLAIGVNRADGAEPQLESIWLIVYFHDSPEVNLIALFPSIAEDGTAYNQQIENSFSLTSDGAPDEAFWKEMEARTILFHNYIVFDMDALQEIAQLMQIEDEYIANPPNWREIPQATLRRQAKLLDKFCYSFKHENLVESISPFLENLGPHISTNLIQWQIEADWQLLAGFRTEMECLFPNLTITP